MCPAELPRPERRNVLILGASPTATLLEHVLGRAGWHRGPGGEVAAIDEDLLRAARGEGAPLARLPEPSAPAVTLEIVHRIARVALHEPFVLADPRFFLTLPVWRPLLGRDCAFVCLFEEPARAARHMAALTGEEDHQGGLLRWNELFRSVLDRQRHAGDWHFTSAEHLGEAESRARLAAFVGAAPHELESLESASASPARRATIRPAPAEALRTHAELCRLAATPPRKRAPAA